MLIGPNSHCDLAECLVEEGWYEIKKRPCFVAVLASSA